MEKIRKYLAQKLKLFDSSDYDEQSQQKILRELNIDGVVETDVGVNYLRSHRNVIIQYNSCLLN